MLCVLLSSEEIGDPQFIGIIEIALYQISICYRLTKANRISKLRTFSISKSRTHTLLLYDRYFQSYRDRHGKVSECLLHLERFDPDSKTWR